MQVPPEVFDKFPDSIPHIGHQGITGILHVNPKLYLRSDVNGLDDTSVGKWSDGCILLPVFKLSA
jgi:hypothetical protein